MNLIKSMNTSMPRFLLTYLILLLLLNSLTTRQSRADDGPTGEEEDHDHHEDDEGCYREEMQLLKIVFLTNSSDNSSPSSSLSSSSSSSSSSLSSSSSSSLPSPLLCRDKFGYASVLDYRRRTAVMCHFYLFPEGPQDTSRMAPSGDLLYLIPIEVNLAVKGHYHRNHSKGQTESHEIENPSSRQKSTKKSSATTNSKNLDEVIEESIQFNKTGDHDNDIIIRNNRNNDTRDDINKSTFVNNSEDQMRLQKSVSEHSDISISADKSISSDTEGSRTQDFHEKMLLKSGAAAMSVLAAAAAAFSGDTLDSLNEENYLFICTRLGRVDCERWQECMSESVSCCQRQIEKRCEKISSSKQSSSSTSSSSSSSSSTSTSSSSPPTCPMTWDGFSCWDEAESETMSTRRCPEYVDATGLYVKSVKTCSENGTWFSIAGQEWTDYMNCYDKSDHVFGVQLNIVLNIISIIFLVLAIWLFAYFRDLMRQERIRLHVHFFISLILVSTFKIIWFALVHYDLLTTAYRETIVDRNPEWCRLISFMVNCLKGTNFTWMFCEAYHLHRLISNAFETPGSMTLLYVIGWFFPILTTLIYAMARYFIDNSRCWTKNIGAYQWIIDAPMCICLLLNLLFLLNILRTLLFQLQAHPNEPNAFRRGLKAGLMLVPLFGVQLLITIYRPDLDPKFGLIYEYFSFVILNSQGIFVSLIFCFLNGEVLTHMKRGLIGWCRGKKKLRSQAYTTQTRGSLLDLTVPNQEEEGGERGVDNSKLGGNNFQEQIIPLRNLHSNGLQI